MSTVRTPLFLLLCVGLPSCAPEAPPPAPPPPRAVTAIRQAISHPSRNMRIAGTATAWKQETLSFQVGGRVVWVIEPERNVSGPTINEKFESGRDGTVIARIDPERYENALAAAKASLSAAKAQLESTKRQLSSVLPQELAQAKAELKRATDNRDRLKRAVERNAVAGTELTNAQAATESARAAADAVRGRIQSMESSLEGYKAEVKRAEQSVRDAELNLRDTELRAPFSGLVTKVSAVRGALVQPGTGIADVMMMDPIKVDLTVSSRTVRALGDQDRALVFADGSDSSILGYIYQRDSTADSATRTIRLSLICRNPDATKAPEGVPVIRDAIPLLEFPTADRRCWFIERRCIQQDAQGTFAWQVTDRSVSQVRGQILNFERVPIQLGKARKDFVGIYQFQEIVPSNEMREVLEYSGLTVDRLRFGVMPKDFKGGKAVVLQSTWTIHPGDVVDVQLNPDPPLPGIYVPASAIAHEGDQTFVLAVRGEAGQQKLERIDVQVSGQVGSLVRLSDKPLADGAPIVSTGTHVLRSGQAVQITKLVTPR